MKQSTDQAEGTVQSQLGLKRLWSRHWRIRRFGHV